MTIIQHHQFTCPLCGNVFESQIVASTNSFGKLHSDLYQEAEGAQPIYYLVHTCTNCGYSGYDDDFQPQDVTIEFRDLVSNVITPEIKGRKIDANGHFYLAALCAEWKGVPPQTIARIYHIGAWYYRIQGEEEKEFFYLHMAAEYYERALSSGEAPKENKATFTYLIGDLYRRMGDPETAKEWYGKVEQVIKENGGDPEILEYAKRQMTSPVDIFT